MNIRLTLLASLALCMTATFAAQANPVSNFDQNQVCLNADQSFAQTAFVALPANEVAQNQVAQNNASTSPNEGAQSIGFANVTGLTPARTPTEVRPRNGVSGNRWNNTNGAPNQGGPTARSGPNNAVIH